MSVYTGKEEEEQRPKFIRIQRILFLVALVQHRARGPAARVTCHGTQDSPLT